MKKTILYSGRLFLFLLLFVSSINSMAQDSLKKIVITYVPQWLLMHSIKLDAEFNINKSKHWIIFSPQVFSGTLFFKNTRNSDYSNYYYDEIYKDEVLGYGLGVSHKMFLQDKHDRGFYTNNGISYFSFTLTRKEHEWVPYTENGLEYYRKELKDGEDNITKSSFFSQVGYRAIGGNAFVFDIYTGVGFSYSEKKSSDASLRNYKRFPWDFNYTGIFPAFGLKFGAYL